MRPVKVSFAAFGSYRRETVIDFRELGEQSFFLIHGATGAGKTTVLDAICFALYGDASGGTREVKMLRNEEAGASEATWVELEFLLGDIVELDGKPWSCCARSFLKSALAQFRAAAYSLGHC